MDPSLTLELIGLKCVLEVVSLLICKRLAACFPLFILCLASLSLFVSLYHSSAFQHSPTLLQFLHQKINMELRTVLRLFSGLFLRIEQDPNSRSYVKSNYCYWIVRNSPSLDVHMWAKVRVKGQGKKDFESPQK